MEKEGVLPDVHPRSPAAADQKGSQGHRLDERKGVGEAGAGGGSALRLCTLGAQSPVHKRGARFPSFSFTQTKWSRVVIVQVRAPQEVGADHLQTVPTRFVRAQ